MLIYESIVTTRNEDGTTHLAPMGVWADGDERVLAPFRPSITLDNLRRERCAVINRSDDVRIFAGCLCGRRDWPLCDADQLPLQRLDGALSHSEVEVVDIREDDVRPQFICETLHEAGHAPFAGFNRAQAAVIEMCILASRLDRLEADKVAREIQYLRIAIEKTAGEHEREAWDWLMTMVEEHRSGRRGSGGKAGGKIGGKAGGKSGGKASGKSGGESGGKAGAKSSDKTGGKSSAKTGGKSGAKRTVKRGAAAGRRKASG